MNLNVGENRQKDVKINEKDYYRKRSPKEDSKRGQRINSPKCKSRNFKKPLCRTITKRRH